jgi:hypothetical protein
MADMTEHPVWAWVMSNPLFLLVCDAAPAPRPAAYVPELGRGQAVAHGHEPPGPCVVSGNAWPLARLFLGRAHARRTTLGLLVASHFEGGSGYLAWSWRFSVVVFIVTLIHLVRYVLRPAGPEEMMIDRLYGGAAAYLLLGLLWCYFYVIREHFSPGSLSGIDSSKPLHIADLVFCSFGSLTTAGGGGFVPQGKAAQMLVLLEELAGTLYMEAFVARLVSMYSSARR